MTSLFTLVPLIRQKTLDYKIFWQAYGDPKVANFGASAGDYSFHIRRRYFNGVKQPVALSCWKGSVLVEAVSIAETSIVAETAEFANDPVYVALQDLTSLVLAQIEKKLKKRGIALTKLQETLNSM